MPLQYTKMTVAALWVIATIIVGLLVDVTSPAGRVVLACIGLLPPLVLLLLWHEPPQTLAESIREGRR